MTNPDCNVRFVRVMLKLKSQLAQLVDQTNVIQLGHVLYKKFKCWPFLAS